MLDKTHHFIHRPGISILSMRRCQPFQPRRTSRDRTESECGRSSLDTMRMFFRQGIFTIPQGDLYTSDLLRKGVQILCFEFSPFSTMFLHRFGFISFFPVRHLGFLRSLRYLKTPCPRPASSFMVKCTDLSFFCRSEKLRRPFSAPRHIRSFSTGFTKTPIESSSAITSDIQPCQFTQTGRFRQTCSII